MKDILLTHAARYPKMEPTDAVKLLYQSEFGGGHLIKNEEACLKYLHTEYESTPQRMDAPLLEDIGNGIFRVSLAALDAHGYSPVTLGQDFIRSSSISRGNLQHFRQQLQLLRELTRAGQMPFSPAELECYLLGYEKAGYPAVSHSDAYREAYHPAYRVVDAQHLPEAIRKSRMF